MFRFTFVLKMILLVDTAEKLALLRGYSNKCKHINNCLETVRKGFTGLINM